MKTILPAFTHSRVGNSQSCATAIGPAAGQPGPNKTCDTAGGPESTNVCAAEPPDPAPVVTTQAEVKPPVAEPAEEVAIEPAQIAHTPYDLATYDPFLSPEWPIADRFISPPSIAPASMPSSGAPGVQTSGASSGPSPRQQGEAFWKMPESRQLDILFSTSLPAATVNAIAEAMPADLPSTAYVRHQLLLQTTLSEKNAEKVSGLNLKQMQTEDDVYTHTSYDQQVPWYANDRLRQLGKELVLSGDPVRVSFMMRQHTAPLHLLGTELEQVSWSELTYGRNAFADNRLLTRAQFTALTEFVERNPTQSEGIEGSMSDNPA